jgi:hypothetical protein
VLVSFPSLQKILKQENRFVLANSFGSLLLSLWRGDGSR